jgi:CIC family chloride channel protein
MSGKFRQLRRRVWALVSRNWRRALQLRQRLRLSDEALNLLLAGGVGVVGGLVNLIFYFCTEWVMKVSLHRIGDPVEVSERLAEWQRVVTPAVGGLVAGAILWSGLRLVGRTGPSNLLEVVAVGDGRLPFRVSMIKALSSLVTIGSGGSIGREGAITQLTAMVASKVGQLAKWPPYRLRLLVACGAAAGIAAPYNAPIGGAMFAAMIVLGNFSMRMFAPLVFASVTACIVSRSFFGFNPWYEVEPFNFTRLTELPWFMVLGVLAGLLGVAFLRFLRVSEEWFQRLPSVFSLLPLRMMAGGLLVGLIAVQYPEVWGNGYVGANRILQGKYLLLPLLGLFLAKLTATLSTVGSGAVGGVFTPTLFLGAALGSLCGLTLHEMGLGQTLPVAAFGLVGMGSVLAATMQSPLLAMILVFEISLNYSLVPALMLGCVISSMVARRLHPESIYAETLRLKEVVAQRETDQAGVATEQLVGEFMREPVSPVRETATLREVGDRFLSSPLNFVPVVDQERRLIGVVALQDLKEFLGAGQELNAVIAYDVMRPPPTCLTPSQRLTDALPTVLASELRNIPVVNSFAEMKLVGSVSRGEMLTLFSEAISRAAPART